MTEENLNLFTESEDELTKLLDRIDDIPEQEVRLLWSKLLADIYDLFVYELSRNQVPQSQTLAAKLAGALAFHYGGRSCYLPTGERLKVGLVHNQLFHEWHSKASISELAKKYGLTDSRVYQVINEQMRLHRNRHQMLLFSDDESASN